VRTVRRSCPTSADPPPDPCSYELKSRLAAPAPPSFSPALIDPRTTSTTPPPTMVDRAETESANADFLPEAAAAAEHQPIVFKKRKRPAAVPRTRTNDSDLGGNAHLHPESATDAQDGQDDAEPVVRRPAKHRRNWVFGTTSSRRTTAITESSTTETGPAEQTITDVFGGRFIKESGQVHQAEDKAT
jgi:hypothetical protein